jgi:hypothetical protein
MVASVEPVEARDPVAPEPAVAARRFDRVVDPPRALPVAVDVDARRALDRDPPADPALDEPDRDDPASDDPDRDAPSPVVERDWRDRDDDPVVSLARVDEPLDEPWPVRAELLEPPFAVADVDRWLRALPDSSVRQAAGSGMPDVRLAT